MSLIQNLKNRIKESKNTRKDWKSALGNKKQFEKSRSKALNKFKDITVGKDSPWTKEFGAELKKEGYKTRKVGNGAVAEK